MRRCVAIAAMIALAGAPLRALPPDPAQRIDRLETIARDASRSTVERLDALDEALGLRRDAMGLAAGTEDFALRAAEFAQAALDRLAWSATDAEARFGLATRDELDRVEHACAEALAACARAREAINARLDDARPGGGSLAPLLVLRDRRLPVIEGRARALAEAPPAAEDTLALGALAFDDPGLESRRLGALALLRLRTGAPEEAIRTLDERRLAAQADILTALTRAAAVCDIDGPDAARAALVGAMDAPPFTDGGEPAPLARLVAASALFRFAEPYAERPTTPDLQTLAIADAFAPFDPYLREAGPLRSAALERMAVGARRIDAPHGLLPPAAIYALARDDGPIEPLVTVAQDPARLGRLGDLAPAALRLVAQRAGGAPAARAWITLARDMAGAPEAEGAPSAAVATAQALYEQDAPGSHDLYMEALDTALEASPNDPSAPVWGYERARILLAQGDIMGAVRAIALVDRSSEIGADAAALAVSIASQAARSYASVQRSREAMEDLVRIADDALTLPQPEARAEAIRAELVRALLILDRPEEALERLEGADQGSPEAAAARLLAQTATARWQEAATTLEGSAAMSGEAIEVARHRFVGHCAAALLERDKDAIGASAAIARGVSELPREGLMGETARLCFALALLHSGDSQGALGVVRETSTRGPTALVEAEALARLGRPREALEVYRSVASPHEGGATPPPNYWSAWAGMLELLAQSSSGAQQARAQIARLRLIDPELGGANARERIEAVERSLPAE